MNIREIEKLAQLFSEESRIRILCLICTFKEVNITDLCKVLDFSQPKVSRHLKTIESEGILKTYRHGQWVYYSLSKLSPDHQYIIDRALESDEVKADIALYQTMYNQGQLAASAHKESVT